MKDAKPWGPVLSWLVTLVVPLLLLMSSIRLLMTPAFVDLEYSMPGFPADTYGMSFSERRLYAKSALEYILNDEPLSFLGDQRFEDGSPLYNQRELGHMLDVKELTQIVLQVWLLLLAFFVGVAVAAWHFGYWELVRSGLTRGAQLTMGLIALVLVFVALSFNSLFTAFHRIFFEGDTWLFQFTDTLIRLFPLRFWQDIFIALGVLSLLGGAVLWALTRRKTIRKDVRKKMK
ncbi:MAG: TIGR01906 family membrane protein [Anaerolineales bacterium]